MRHGWFGTLVAAMAVMMPAGLDAQTRPMDEPLNRNLGEADYGVCRGVDPVCFHDWQHTPTTTPRILVYSRTGVSRHASLGRVLAGGLNPPLGADNVAQAALVRLAAENGWAVDHTEDVATMTDLNGYNAVVFLSTSRDALDDAARTALRQYVRAGGGFVAIHNAFGTLYNWPYYEGLLGGANFYDHGPPRDGDVVTVDRVDGSTKDLPARWRFHDEWYNLVPFPTRVRFLATVDEASWSAPATATAPATTGGPGAEVPGGPGGGFKPPRYPSVVGRHPGHGRFHPVAWCHYYDGGKAWVTTLGHDADSYRPAATDTGAARFQQMLVGGIRSVMGLTPFCR